MLAIAIDCHQAVIPRLDRKIECGAKPRPITEIPGMADHLNLREISKQVGSVVGRAVVNHENVARVAKDLVEHRFQVRLLVIDRDGGEHSHGAGETSESPTLHGTYVVNSFDLRILGSRKKKSTSGLRPGSPACREVNGDAFSINEEGVAMQRSRFKACSRRESDSGVEVAILYPCATSTRFTSCGCPLTGS